MTDLDERLMEQYEDEVQALINAGAEDEWRITNLDVAGWASRKAAAFRKQEEEVKAWERREVDRIRAVAQAERARLSSEADFFEKHLFAFLRAEIANGRKQKSLTLPGGTVALRKRQPELTVDKDEFIAWAREANPDLVRVKEEVALTALKKALKLVEDGAAVMADSGEPVPGVTWAEQEDSGTFTPLDT